ncbi:hypothetical protein [Geobacter argillaceus]|uniref:Uncharacterized protein n=1 Tax=Geobacter argillaceus TaxID=345631 RepID=A0A562VMX8_9BACT|nr:hypothetical protein [Geobacter argillaceus]TWJ19077.1 hypothetical protein JN12_02023 [Geobacter argillaceus]
MKLFGYEISLLNFTRLDHQIGKFRAIRDSYREANVQIYGEQLARLLDGDEI